MAKRTFPLSRVYQPAGTRSGGAGHDRTQGQGEHHDPVVAHDDGIRAASGGLCNQRENEMSAVLQCSPRLATNGGFAHQINRTSDSISVAEIFSIWSVAMV